MMIKRPTKTSVSARLARDGFGRNTSILRGTVVLSGFRVTEGSRTQTVNVAWLPGSEFDALSDERWAERIEAERQHMGRLYETALKDHGYEVKRTEHGHVIVQART